LDACLVSLDTLLALDAKLHTRAKDNGEIVARLYGIVQEGLADAQEFKSGERGIAVLEHGLTVLARLTSVDEGCRRVVVEGKFVPLIVAVFYPFLIPGPRVSV
jgi:hypothetical protein